MLTESTEQLIWAVNGTPDGKTKATKWTFNYQRAKELNDGKQMRNMWEFSVTPRSERSLGKHPSQKPLRLLERLVELGTNPGDLVIDPFGGAGTLAVAAEKLGREFVLIESVEEYANLTEARLAELRSPSDSGE